ncbi:MAG: lipopolysaccharide heptosyltransferase II [Candidatus Omnitrophota bacterium]|nr:lipopolysaccharide heptosyltransferase II [Candidatus Omnitrophota bacterium]
MKILFITLSNIGDCILTLPVLDFLRQKYPDAAITCLVPPRPKEIFINNPAVADVVIFDKHAKLIDKIKLFFALSKGNFDIVVDLRNSFFGAFLPARKRSLLSGPLRRIPAKIKHMKEKHLFWANLLEYSKRNKEHQSLNITFKDVDYIQGILSEQNLTNSAKIIVIAPGSRSRVKCWDKQNFSQLCSQLVKEGNQIVLVGDSLDQPICNYLGQACGKKIINLCAKTNLSQLAALLNQAQLLITNDSAVMHLASYLNVPVVAIFGPTDEKKYGPWSQSCAVVKKDIFCRPCEKAQCRFGSLKCLTSIKPVDVLIQVKSMLANKGDGSLYQGIEHEKRTVPGILYHRILIVRTDRLGDVLLSTPVIKALRQKFPQGYISMMVSPYTKDVLDGNPALDEIIAFDKDAKDKCWLATLKFAGLLRKKKFDLAIVLHPTTRMHLLTFLAGIPKRLGYDRKFGFLLTDRIKHTKQYGQKHESEYALDLIRYLGIQPQDKTLFMPIKQESEKWVDVLFSQAGIRDSDKLLVIHPTASCHSRIWPGERFAEVADKLAQKYGFKVVIISGPKDMQKAQEVIKNMRIKALNLAGKTSISQLASLLRRCQLFISTDSGPMHMASALGVPVITIFGRSQAGLSPQRWGPLGEKNRILHKTVGCTICLAHNCQKDFACLKATSVEDVLRAAESILKSRGRFYLS